MVSNDLLDGDVSFETISKIKGLQGLGWTSGEIWIFFWLV